VQAGIAGRVERALRVTRSAHAQGFHVSASGPATTTAGEAPTDARSAGTPANGTPANGTPANGTPPNGTPPDA